MCVSPQKGNPFPYAAESDVLSDSHLAVNDNITPSNFLSKYSPPRSSARFSPSLPPCCVGEPAHFVGSRGAARRGRYVVWWWGVSVMPLWSGTCALCGAVVGCVGDATMWWHLRVVWWGWWGMSVMPLCTGTCTYNLHLFTLVGYCTGPVRVVRFANALTGPRRAAPPIHECLPPAAMWCTTLRQWLCTAARRISPSGGCRQTSGGGAGTVMNILEAVKDTHSLAEIRQGWRI